MLVDDPDVRWPDAVLPGSPAARIARDRGRARDAEIDRRREARAEADEARRTAREQRNRSSRP